MRVIEAESKVVFCLPERFDASNVESAKSLLKPVLERDELTLHVDLVDTRIIDSTGLGFLVSILKTLRVGEGELVLTRPSPTIQKLLKLTSLDQVFTIRNDDAEESEGAASCAG